jgi:PAS domain S-box-containing protein
MEKAFSELVAHAPVFVRKLNGEIVYWTGGAEELYGYDFGSALGRVSHELLRTTFPEPLGEINKQLATVGVWQGLLGHRKADGTTIWVESRWRMRPPSDDAEPIVVESNTDVTQRENLARELSHRVKNTLAVVQALARLTFQRDGERVMEFEERLRAMAAAHDLLLQHHWAAAGFAVVIERALMSLGVQDRVSLKGADVLLKPSAVLAYLMAFHELAVNALKHGALSVSGGRVEVSWTPREEMLSVLWRELGGPAPKADRPPGSGMVLLQRFVAAELGGPVNLRFEPAGLICEFGGPTQKDDCAA